mmetsp:Transcript_11695/g.29580  ORF Transcript_11695/g.29580 Transcript_11695/m.29580 type:complete len:285 (-) Transcript_11695:231-1085(-)
MKPPSKKPTKSSHCSSTPTAARTPTPPRNSKKSRRPTMSYPTRKNAKSTTPTARRASRPAWRTPRRAPSAAAAAAPAAAAPTPAANAFSSLLGGGDGNVCNLADHKIRAGCTAVVALIVGNEVIVANAGDSKAVMSRSGKAIGLSFEHKPNSDIERERIHNAGGFVSSMGRVNNNLNLSRSIGDLKYKCNKAIPPSAQMITAEPDTERAAITPDDEFIIIACDGVWDILSNQEAVDFVRERMTKGVKLSGICEEVFERCISADPRRTSGLGGDNMTCLIIELKR